MRRYLKRFCILFTITTLIFILLKGFFHTWTLNTTESWGFIVGGLGIALMIYEWFWGRLY